MDLHGAAHAGENQNLRSYGSTRLLGNGGPAYRIQVLPKTVSSPTRISTSSTRRAAEWNQLHQTKE